MGENEIGMLHYFLFNQHFWKNKFQVAIDHFYFPDGFLKYLEGIKMKGAATIKILAQEDFFRMMLSRI